MTRRVPYSPPLPKPGLVLASKGISTKTWGSMSSLVNYLNGGGVQLVPQTTVPMGAIATGTTRTLRFWVQPQQQNVAYLWSVGVRSTDASRRASAVDITAPSGGTTQRFSALATRGAPPLTIVETLPAQSSTEGEISISLKAIDYSVQWETVGCLAIPRSTLYVGDTPDYGVDNATVLPRQPIFEDAASGGRSLAEVMKALAVARTNARRAGLWHLPLPDDASGAIQVTTAGPAWQTLYSGGLPTLCRKLYNGSTTGLVYCKVLSWGSVAGLKLNFRVNTTSGGAGTATLAGQTVTTSPAWYAVAANGFVMDCEDLAVADGRRSSRFDLASFEASVSGAGTIYVATISGYEVE